MYSSNMLYYIFCSIRLTYMNSEIVAFRHFDLHTEKKIHGIKKRKIMSISVKIALGRPETFIFWDTHPLIGSNFKVAQL